MSAIHEPQMTSWHQKEARLYAKASVTQDTIGPEYVRIYASQQDISNTTCDPNCISQNSSYNRLFSSSNDVYKDNNELRQNGNPKPPSGSLNVPDVAARSRSNSAQLSLKSAATVSPSDRKLSPPPNSRTRLSPQLSSGSDCGSTLQPEPRGRSASQLSTGSDRGNMLDVPVDSRRRSSSLLSTGSDRDTVSVCSSMGIPTSYPPQPSIHGSMSCLTADIPLSHIDFWPACRRKALLACDAVFETFDVLVQKANRWMQQFNTYELINCETVDKKVIYVKDIYSAAMYFTDEDETVLATHIKGLRVWYRNKPGNSPRVTQELGFTDVIPRYLNPGEKHPIFETLPETVDKINQRLARKPLPGKVISIESISLKIAREDWSEHIRLNPSYCQWYDEYNIHQITFIRLFYIRGHGSPCNQVIGVIDFTPDALDEGGIFHPAKYTPFSQLFTKASVWIKNNPSVQVTNIQSLDTKHRKKSENHGHRFNTDKMFEYRIEERFRAFFIRIGYVIRADVIRADVIRADVIPEHVGPELQCRMYLPYKKTTGYENITELLHRVEIAIRDTGARVYHVETLPMPEWITKPELCEKGERTFFDGEWYFIADQDGNDRGPYRYTLIYAIRVYYVGLPSGYGILQKPSKAKKTCCFIM